MSRLYIKHNSDLRKGTGHGSSQETSAAVYWGNARDSKLCASIRVCWPKGEEKPTVSILYSKDLKPHLGKQ